LPNVVSGSPFLLFNLLTKCLLAIHYPDLISRAILHIRPAQKNRSLPR
jgi:hypothetical protein